MDFMILPALLAGLLGSLVLTAILCLLRRFLYVPFARRILLEKAIQRGNVVTARLVKSVDTAQEYGSGYVASNQEYGIYRYEFQGKTYKRRTISSARLPGEIHLFFLRNPAKAAPENEVGDRESRWGICYAVIAALLTVI